VDSLAYGSFVADNAVAAGLAEAEVWRGVVLRRFAVGAWRRLWAHMVNDLVVDLVTTSQVADAFADELPDLTVGQFLRSLPDTMIGADTAPAEELLRAVGGSLPAIELGVLAIGGFRAGQLTGHAGDAFRGRPIELAPEWVARRFEQRSTQSLRDFGKDLVADLLVRGRRVAMSKMKRRSDGTIWLPTRLYDRGGLLYRTSTEGAGDVGMRIVQLGQILAGVGVFSWIDERWHLTEVGGTILHV
jgi:hypothetical protein